MSYFLPPWLFGLFGMANCVLAFVQDSGDARWYRFAFGLLALVSAWQMWIIERLAEQIPPDSDAVTTVADSPTEKQLAQSAPSRDDGKTS